MTPCAHCGISPGYIPRSEIAGEWYMNIFNITVQLLSEVTVSTFINT